MFIILNLSGCSNQVETNENVEADFQEQVKKMHYPGYFQKEVPLSPYEPLEGAYLGAYVLGNPQIEFDITQFETAVDKRVAVAIRHYQLGDPFPDQWLLQCLAEKKAPHIVITPEHFNQPYDKAILEATALKFKNTYGVPVFIEFYPGPKEYGDPAQYIAYFQLAKEIFSYHAPNVAFVWSMDMEDVYDAMVYYPGDDYVDWVGMRMYIPIHKDNARYKVDVNQYLDYFYTMYQDKKPMMISKLAISHYSKKGHTFYVDEAISMIDYLYTQLPVYYPRIKGVHYIDIDNIKMAPDGTGSDNFSVSTEPKITKAYKKAISDPYYLQDVDQIEHNHAYEWMKMRTPLYERNGQRYILEAMLLHDWDIEDLGPFLKDKVIIGGGEYYNLDLVTKRLGYRYTLDGGILRVYQKN